MRLTRTLSLTLATLLLLAFVLQGRAVLRHMASTGDETHYLGMGCYLLKTHRWDLDDALLHPPLSYYIHSVPLLFIPIDYKLFETPDLNERGRRLLESFPEDRLLQLARIPILILAALLGCLILLWGWQAWGPAAGLTALFLYVFSPVILGNAALITPDLCLTLFSTLTFYLLWRYSKRHSYVTLLGVGAALGLSLLSKYTGILVAVSVIAILIVGAYRRREGASAWWSVSLRSAFVLATALLVVDAGYLFVGTFGWMDNVAFHSRLFQELASTGIFHRLPMPLPQAYVRGVDLQYTVLENGFNYYMLGQISKTGWFLYYALAFLLKSPVPFLLLLLLAMFLLPGRRIGILQWILLLPVLLFFSYFSFTKVSRGLRYLLPAYPLMFLWAGQAVPAAFERLARYRRYLLPAFAALALWYAAGTVRIAPHYLAYFNELCGGPDHGGDFLWEADFDWGQELKALAGYLHENGIERVQLGYFGTDDPTRYGIEWEPLPCDESKPKPEDPPVVLSATALDWDCYSRWKKIPPDKKIGYTIFIYNLRSAADTGSR